MKKTPIFILVSTALIIAYDIYIIAIEGKDESISAYAIRLAYEAPLFPFTVGVLIGHLFWSFDIKRLYVDKKKDKDGQ